MLSAAAFQGKKDKMTATVILTVTDLTNMDDARKSAIAKMG